MNCGGQLEDLKRCIGINTSLFKYI